MDRQGLVMTVNKRSAVVLTKDHEYLKIRRRQNVAVGQTIWFSATDVMTASSIWEGIEMKRKTLAWTMAVVMVIAIGAIVARSGLVPLPGSSDTTAQTQMGVTESAGTKSLAAEPAVAVLTVEINPAVDLYISAKDKVIKAEALNEDAEKLALESIVGLSADEAVEKVIEMAYAAGFIEEDEVTDYVTLTQCPLAIGATEDVDTLLTQIRSQIQTRIQNNEHLQNVEMAMIRATEQQRIQAQQENIAIGLKLLNQRAEQAGLGQANSIRDYFANQERLQLAQQNGLMMQRQAGQGNAEGTQETMRETNRETQQETNRETSGSMTSNESSEPNGPGGPNGTGMGSGTQQGSN